MGRYLLIAFSFLLFSCDHAQQPDDSRILIPYRVKDQWGYADRQGQVVISPQYDSAGFFKEPHRWDFKRPFHALVVKREKLGLINTANKMVIPAEYDKIEWAEWGYKVRKDKKVGAHDREGKQIIAAKYDYVWMLADTMLVVGKDGLKGVYNKKGKLIIPVDYQTIGYDKGIFTVTHSSYREFEMDKEGRLLTTKNIPVEEAVGKIEDKKFIITDTIPLQYYPTPPAQKTTSSSARIFTSSNQLQELDKVIVDKDKYGYVWRRRNPADNFNTWITDTIPAIYDSIMPLFSTTRDHFMVLQKGKWGIVNLKNEMVLSAQYEWIDASKAKYPVFGHIAVRQNGKWGVIGILQSQKILIPTVYDDVKVQSHWYILVKDGLIGIAASEHRGLNMVITEPKFARSGKQFEYRGVNFITIITKEGRTGYIDENGRTFFTD